MKLLIRSALGLSVTVQIAACSDPHTKLRGEIISACMQGGAPKSICVCSYEHASAKYSDEDLQLLRDARKVPKGMLDDIFNESLKCATHFRD